MINNFYNAGSQLIHYSKYSVENAKPSVSPHLSFFVPLNNITQTAV